ncbi:DUF3107 domain-containing protein [Rothia sp. LK2588]|uniref:DUF3107 domain-containing protein n=1 Tax=Rothia sp. LK2588 TaxID=3114369 RepID=UPI0034CD18B6
MEIKIGVQHVQRELVIETEETSSTIKARVAQVLAEGGVLELEDTKGNVTLIPAREVGYLEIGAETKRRIGFGHAE